MTTLQKTQQAAGKKTNKQTNKKQKKTRIAKTILNNKITAGGITTLDLNLSTEQ